ncbi:MAG: SDR family oxidoreductase [Pseudomonadota bacterium]
MTSILVTGITGNVGVELLRVLVRTRPNDQVRLLIRARDAKELAVRWKQTLSAAVGDTVRAEDLPGFSPVRGDVSVPGLALEPRELEGIESETTHIVNSASLTNFAATSALLTPVNVAGLEHVLAVAKNCRRLEAFAQLSTCFAAGRRQGRILEDDLEHDAGFTNAYEQSKYTAEHTARLAMRDLPLSVYRLSLLVGRSDGYIHNSGAFHYFLDRLYAGMFPLIPGNSEARFDLLPTDYAVEVVTALCFERFQAGKTYHIAAGDSAPRTGDWLKATTDLFMDISPAWKSGAHVPPEIVNLATYKALVDTVHTVGNKTLAHMLKVIDSIAEYPLSTKVFDRQSVLDALGDSLPVPAFETYYPAIVARATRVAA